MTDRRELLADVSAILRRVAAEVVLPRFGTLTAAEVSEKGPGDLVSVADAEAERLLTERLHEVLPATFERVAATLAPGGRLDP